jgi:very-short-patch-repair endonuclease
MNTALARKLRQRMPPAEARMWNLLRAEPFRAWHFRRQVALAGYFADFASHGAKLVIEVDGDTHGTEEAQRYDAIRDAALRREGYKVVRLTNRDVMNNLAGVGTILIDLLAATPTRPLRGHPPHKGVGEEAT